jgi:hypothetical protein
LGRRKHLWEGKALPNPPFSKPSLGGSLGRRKHLWEGKALPNPPFSKPSGEGRAREGLPSQKLLMSRYPCWKGTRKRHT